MNVGFFELICHGTQNVGRHRGKPIFDYRYEINDQYIIFSSLTNIHHPSRNGELKESDICCVSINGNLLFGKEAFYILKSILKMVGKL
ncbi:MAG: hypothetical protein CL489_08360 [Acidobacteria bacterium]|nr:hypothetical protein [Acidobacteriota bacterium]|tara:strand:- start:61763 stop:62026 length:264 start_codon:yes stop_codon:yes gene_type:complete